MPDRPTVSIVIPAYNAAGTIGETLDSVAAQTFEDYEVLVVDDASTDSTLQVLDRRNDGCRVIGMKKNSGPAAARNRGIAQARGDWIAFLDADDTWLPNRLEIQMLLAEAEPEVAMWCGGTIAYKRKADPHPGPLPRGEGGERADPHPSPLPEGEGGDVGVALSKGEGEDCPSVLSPSGERIKVRGEREITLEALAVRNPIATSSVLVRKAVLEAAGGFDESFCGPEDYDLWIRIAVSNRIKRVETPIACYREQSGSLSMDDRKFMPQVLRVIQKAYAKDGALAAYPHLRGAALMHQYDHAAWMAFCRGARWTALRWFMRAQLASFAGRGRSCHSFTALLKHFCQYLLKSPPELRPAARRVFDDIRSIRRMPTAVIGLMSGSAEENDCFYRDLLNKYWREARKRHPRFPLVRALSFGMALCRLPDNADDYFMMIDASARRNVKKARRHGYSFAPIDFNAHLDEIAEIRCSTDERQGRMPDELLSGKVERCKNPPSKTDVHDYPYFGVFTKDGKLVAYAGCFVAGEACLVEHILGHARFQRDGIVPMLVVGMAGYVMERYPNVKYYGYGTYFGAGESLRRFKRKLGFRPHWVKWYR